MIAEQLKVIKSHNKEVMEQFDIETNLLNIL
jgi:hypothetical protein